MCDKDFDLTFVIDGSGSINDAGRGNFDRVKNFTKDLINGFRIGYDKTHVGAIIFSDASRVNKVFGLEDYHNKDDMFKEIDDIKYPSGGTFTGKALESVRKDLYKPVRDREDKPNVCIVITDGKSEDSVEGPADTLRSEKKATIFAIGVGKNFDRNELKRMAGDPAKVFTAGFNDLENIIERIKLSACRGWF